MYHDGRVQLCVGACSAMLSWVAGLSLSQDVIPIISMIGVVAGTFVALHGVYEIVKKWFKRKHNSSFY